MKKLLSLFCCILYIHNISYASVSIKAVPATASGEKILVKALAAIVNREGKKKKPVRKANHYFTECV